MILNIEIEDRIYRDIESFCNANRLSINDYISGIITEKHSLNKYGDLNDILPKVIEESVVEVKKRGRPKKKDVEDKLGEGKSYESSEVTNELSKVLTDAIDEKDKKSIEDELKEEGKINSKPTAKRKRTLKTL